MAQQDQKREALFNKFTDQIARLRKMNMLPARLQSENPDTYYCPICLEPFLRGDLQTTSPKMLTLEDAPPDSLGGRKIALTCKACNNTCGHEIDSYLSLGMNELDQKSFLPGVELDVYFVKDSEKITGQLKVGENAFAKAFHQTKRNNPKKLGNYISDVKAGGSVYVEFKKTKFDERKLGLALLKTAYILTFAKFGYTFLMDPSYVSIRQQLLNPEKSIYPLNFWTSKPFAPEHEGVHLLLNTRSERFFPVFALKTKFETRRFGVYLPIAGIPIEHVLSELNKGAGLGLHLDPAQGDFIGNDVGIKEINKWIKQLQARTIGSFMY